MDTRQRHLQLQPHPNSVPVSASAPVFVHGRENGSFRRQAVIGKVVKIPVPTRKREGLQQTGGRNPLVIGEESSSKMNSKRKNRTNNRYCQPLGFPRQDHNSRYNIQDIAIHISTIESNVFSDPHLLPDLHEHVDHKRDASQPREFIIMLILCMRSLAMLAT